MRCERRLTGTTVRWESRRLRRHRSAPQAHQHPRATAREVRQRHAHRRERSKMQHNRQPRPGDPHRTDGTTCPNSIHVGDRIASPGRQRAQTVLATRADPPTTLPANRRREMARSMCKRDVTGRPTGHPQNGTDEFGTGGRAAGPARRWGRPLRPRRTRGPTWRSEPTTGHSACSRPNRE